MILKFDQTSWLGHLSSVKSQEMVIYWLTPNIERSRKMMKSDCREMTEERLIELSQQSMCKEVKVLSWKLNIELTGSKLQVITQIQREMQNDKKLNLKGF